MRWCLVVTAMLLASGCLSDDADPPAPSTDDSVQTDTTTRTPSAEPPIETPDEDLVVWYHTSVGPANATLFGAQPPRFEQRYVHSADGRLRNSTEPTLEFGHGRLYYAAHYSGDHPNGGDADRHTRIEVSDDLGRTWTSAPPATDGWDPILQRDPTTGRVLYSELRPGEQTEGLMVLYWTDDGSTWDETRFTVGPQDDHQTLFFAARDTASVGYMCSSQAFTALCATSTDGGETWGQRQPVFTATDVVQDCPEHPLEAPTFAFFAGLTGHGQGSLVDGTTYLPKIWCGQAWVAISEDDGATWTRVAVDATPLGDRGIQHDASLAIDEAGNAYYAFVDGDGLPRLSVSQDRGATWSPSIVVSPPHVTAATHLVAMAGDTGRIGIFYVGTTADGGHAATGDTLAEAEWHGYVTVSRAALADTLVFATVLATPEDPLRRGGPCSNNCLLDDPASGMRTQGFFDYLDAKVDPATGLMGIALIDLCNDACATGNATSDVHRSSLGAVAVQIDGWTLTS